MAKEQTATIVMKAGEIFENKKLPDCPFGEHERVISFYYGKILRCYPLNDVKYIDLDLGDV